jgi:hypothetical protein
MGENPGAVFDKPGEGIQETLAGYWPEGRVTAVQPANSYPASSTASRSGVSPGSGSPEIRTVPAATSTSTPLTPGSLLISALTALAQCSQVIPVTVMERVGTVTIVTPGRPGADAV